MSQFPEAEPDDVSRNSYLSHRDYGGTARISGANCWLRDLLRHRTTAAV
ncbi:MAG TPA: hypothetical protein VM165_21790 [Planctomycetaceae bacterium]|nr:hypothetical protein [Planctomycetaceae bacterium]